MRIYGRIVSAIPPGTPGRQRFVSPCCPSHPRLALLAWFVVPLAAHIANLLSGSLLFPGRPWWVSLLTVPFVFLGVHRVVSQAWRRPGPTQPPPRLQRAAACRMAPPSPRAPQMRALRALIAPAGARREGFFEFLFKVDRFILQMEREVAARQAAGLPVVPAPPPEAAAAAGQSAALSSALGGAERRSAADGEDLLQAPLLSDHVSDQRR